MFKRALIVFSGGLDSILSAKILLEQGFAVTALTFVTPFFDAEKAKIAAQKLGIVHIIQDITEEHLLLVKNPPHGYGKNLNPCLDCHGLMFRLAGTLARAQNFDIVATGEVLGQRSFSQNKQSLQLVEKIAGMQGRILRPLSAQNLHETEYEKTGLIERGKLLDLQSKSRKRQIELATQWKIDFYPTPAGGCLLTDAGFSARLQDLWQHHPEASSAEISLLKLGRHFWFAENKVIVGREQAENLQLKNFFNPQKMLLLKLESYPGPTGLVYLYAEDKVKETLQFAAGKIKNYALKTRDLQKIVVKYWGKEEGELVV